MTGVRARRIEPALKYGLIVFLVSRIFLSLWAAFVLIIQPIPLEEDEVLRPYLGEPIIHDGISGILLGPWQRFDTQHYMRIARAGFEAEEDSVFPPVYPLLVRGTGLIFQGLIPVWESHLLAGIIISNMAFLGTLIMLFRMTEEEFDLSSAKRSIIYFAIFPTAFFLTAAYTEPLFLFFAIASIWSARRGNYWWAGILALLAPLSRLTGWILVVPLVYEYLRQHQFRWREFRLDFLLLLLPLFGIIGFVAGRSIVGLPPLTDIYQQYWHQTTAVPGSDLVTAVEKMISGEAAFTLFFDFFVAILLFTTLVLTFRKLGPTLGLYSTMLLLFMLLPASELKPLFSFSRYALAFFPMFMIFGQAGSNPWINRLISYPSIALYLYFSAQFFMWGWVA